MVKFNFGDCHSFIDDDFLIAGFMSGLQSFMEEITGTSIRSIDLGDYLIYFFKVKKKI